MQNREGVKFEPRFLHKWMNTQNMRSGILSSRNCKLNGTGCSCFILDRKQFGHTIEKHENQRHFQFVGWAVGHGESRKPWNKYTSGNTSVDNIDDGFIEITQNGAREPRGLGLPTPPTPPAQARAKRAETKPGPAWPLAPHQPHLLQILNRQYNRQFNRQFSRQFNMQINSIKYLY